jgi:hypothetical protein
MSTPNTIAAAAPTNRSRSTAAVQSGFDVVSSHLRQHMYDVLGIPSSIALISNMRPSH